MLTNPPGPFKAGVALEMAAILRTAGHTGHGKTSLVNMLTGRGEYPHDDSGFAMCPLEEKRCAGIVDSSAHERVIHGMAPGITETDVALMVVAADEGVMPLTVEHLDILRFLGVRHGFVVITKMDLVSPERLEETREEVAILVEGTFLESAPVCCVSCVTGGGLPALRETLATVIKHINMNEQAGLFRMPITRISDQRGPNIALTGVPVSGRITIGEEVELLPGGARGKVRGIQCLQHETPTGELGHYLTINVSGFARQAPERGQVLCEPGALRPTPCFLARISVLPGVNPAVRTASEVILHTGASAVAAKVYPLDGDTLISGGMGYVTLVTDNPLPVAHGDRFILRRVDSVNTIAGGEVLTLYHGAGRPSEAIALETARECGFFFADTRLYSPEGMAKRVAWALRHDLPMGGPIRLVARAALLSLDTARPLVADLVKKGEVLTYDADFFIHRMAYSASLELVRERIGKLAAETLNLTVVVLRKGFDWPASLWARIQQDLEDEGSLLVRGDKVVILNTVDPLSPNEEALLDRIMALFEDSGWDSPRSGDLPGLLEAPVAVINKLLKLLVSEGSLIRLNKDTVMTYNTVKRAQDQLIAAIRKHGQLDATALGKALGAPPQYVSAILDFLNARGIISDSEGAWRLLPGYEKQSL